VNEAGRRARLESALRQAMERAGAAEATIASVMAAGCRLDGVGAGGVSEELDRAGARLRRRIGELAAALDRLDAGRYGTCDGCGRPIDDARLDLLPEATLCRRCAGGAAGG
jgi:RNA polymerase-binding transcription factor DksA